MYIRHAFFKGEIISGMEENFHGHWRQNLVSLWSSFPNLLELHVMREVESDEDNNPFPLGISMKFSSIDHMEQALKSEVRYKSKETSKKLFEMFDGVVFHTVFAVDQFEPIN